MESKSRSKGEFKGKSAKSKRKRKFSQSDEEGPAFLSSKYAEPPASKIYNSRFKKNPPAELFRKDLISAMKLPDSEPLDPNDYWLIEDAWKPEWEKGVQVPVEPDALPEPNAVELRKRDKNLHFKLPKKLIHTSQDSTFNSDVHFLRYCTEFSQQSCRYDLDDVDLNWLSVINEDREDFGLQPIDEATLEKIIEELEDLCNENFQEALRNEPGISMVADEDAICDVCRSPDSEDGNEIVFCDACNVSVHQSCYGITKIPEGSWICRTCALDLRPSCVLCPNRGGAMKPTKMGDKWCHVSCAIWIPEVSIGCVEKMEPITKISHIPPFRWTLVCILCEEKVGVCIQCSAKSCKTAYHVTCAFKARLRMRAIMGDDDDDALKLKSYCLKHTQENSVFSDSDSEEVNKKEIEMTSEEKYSTRENKLREKEADFFQYASVDEIMSICDYDRDVVEAVYNYWKLKRKANFNQPLLRLREVKTDDNELKENYTYNLVKRLVNLRRELERARNLCYMVSKREKMARSWMQAKQDIFSKQSQILLGTSQRLSKEEHNAVLMANYGDMAYDKAHTGSSSPSPLILRVLNTLIGEEQTKAQLNGILKLRKKRDEVSPLKKLPNPYAKHYLNGLLKRSQRWLASVDRRNWQNAVSSQCSSCESQRCRSFTCTSHHLVSESDLDMSKGSFTLNESCHSSGNVDSLLEGSDVPNDFFRQSTATNAVSYVNCDVDSSFTNAFPLQNYACSAARNRKEDFKTVIDCNSCCLLTDGRSNNYSSGTVTTEHGSIECLSGDSIVVTEHSVGKDFYPQEENKGVGKKQKCFNRILLQKKLQSSEELNNEKVYSWRNNNCRTKEISTSHEEAISREQRESKVAEKCVSVEAKEAGAQSTTEAESCEDVSDASFTDVYHHYHTEKYSDCTLNLKLKDSVCDPYESVKENKHLRSKFKRTIENKLQSPMDVRYLKNGLSSEKAFIFRRKKQWLFNNEGQDQDVIQSNSVVQKASLCNGENKASCVNHSPCLSVGNDTELSKSVDHSVISRNAVSEESATSMGTCKAIENSSYVNKHHISYVGENEFESPVVNKFDQSSPLKEVAGGETLPSHSGKMTVFSTTTIRKGSLTGYKIPKKVKTDVVEEENSGHKRGSSPLSPLPDLSSGSASSASYTTTCNRYQRFKSFDKRNDHQNYPSNHNHMHHKAPPHHHHHRYGITATDAESQVPVVTSSSKVPPQLAQPLAPPVSLPPSESFHWKSSYHSKHKEVPGVHWRPLHFQRKPDRYHDRYSSPPLRPWTRLRRPREQRSVHLPYGPGPPHL